MGSNAMKVLAENLNRLIGPGGVYSSNVSASAASDGITRSTFDRARKGDRLGASAIAIDKLDGIAGAFGLEVWQLFVPGIEANTPPNLGEVGNPAANWSLKKSTAARVRALSPQQQKKLDDMVDAVLKGFEAERGR